MKRENAVNLLHAGLHEATLLHADLHGADLHAAELEMRYLHAAAWKIAFSVPRHAIMMFSHAAA